MPIQAVSVWEPHTDDCKQEFKRRGRPKTLSKDCKGTSEQLNRSTAPSWGDPQPLSLCLAFCHQDRASRFMICKDQGGARLLQSGELVNQCTLCVLHEKTCAQHTSISTSRLPNLSYNNMAGFHPSLPGLYVCLPSHAPERAAPQRLLTLRAHARGLL